jgi:tryptophanyl-tRNA synthetase
LVEDDTELQKIYDECKKGKLICGEDKKHCCELMTKFMEDFVKKTEKAKKEIDKLKFVEFK